MFPALPEGIFTEEYHVLFHVWKINLSQCVLLQSLKILLQYISELGRKFLLALRLHPYKGWVVGLNLYPSPNPTPDFDFFPHSLLIQHSGNSWAYK